jgi:hypothetical protein
MILNLSLPSGFCIAVIPIEDIMTNQKASISKYHLKFDETAPKEGSHAFAKQSGAAMGGGSKASGTAEGGKSKKSVAFKCEEDKSKKSDDPKKSKSSGASSAAASSSKSGGGTPRTEWAMTQDYSENKIAVFFAHVNAIRCASRLLEEIRLRI